MPHRTTLLMGGVEADVSLVKTSGSPREAQYEVRRFDVPPDGAARALEPEPRQDPLTGSSSTKATVLVEPEKPRIQHGVTVEGRWVDLTDSLAEIDEATKLDGLSLVAVVNRPNVPNLRVRDSYYLTADGKRELDVLAHLWRGLKDTRSAALVRWTKRKNQSLGVVIARARPAHLCLLEVEWAENMRAVPDTARLTNALADVSERGRVKVGELMEAYMRPASAFDEVRDERTGQRAELLESARRGERWAPPETAPESEAATELRELIAQL